MQPVGFAVNPSKAAPRNAPRSAPHFAKPAVQNSNSITGPASQSSRPPKPPKPLRQSQSIRAVASASSAASNVPATLSRLLGKMTKQNHHRVVHVLLLRLVNLKPLLVLRDLPHLHLKEEDGRKRSMTPSPAQLRPIMAVRRCRKWKSRILCWIAAARRLRVYLLAWM